MHDMTIYEAFTSGKEVRRRSGELIKAMVLVDWVESEQPIAAFDDKSSFATYHDENGIYSLTGKVTDQDLYVAPPDPRDEVIKAAEAWYDVLVSKYNTGSPAGLLPQSYSLIEAIEKLRKNRDNGL